MRIDRRKFLKAGGAAAAAKSAGLSLPTVANGEPSAGEIPPPPFNTSIREYLVREARRITARALADIPDGAAWQRFFPERRQQFMEMMGLEDLPARGQRPPLNVKITGVVERASYRIEKLHYESLPKLYMTGNLYVPNRLAGRAPGVLYVCGHSAKQKVAFQAHARRFAELGFVCLLVETVQLGEARGYHHGPYYESWFHWYSRGYAPGGIELLNGIRGLDLLEERPEVDAKRLGVTGISGGGATSWYVAAADERIAAAAPVCGTATLESHIADLTIDGHCDCMWWNNTYLWDLADLGALVAPRPLMIASADHDEIFTLASIRKVHSQLQRLYQVLGAPQNLRLVETPGPHSYHERSRTAIFFWFLKHLQGKDVPPERVGDLDESPAKQETEETLRVYVHGAPEGNRTPTIHEDFFTPPAPPEIPDAASLEATRRRVIEALRRRTFGAFPSAPPPLALEVEYEFVMDNLARAARFAFTSEAGWRLHGSVTLADKVPAPAPAVVALRSPNEKRDGSGTATDEFLSRVRLPWAKVIVEPRGTGETAWGEELSWHLRRATAWMGRTLASMRVYDTLRALEAVRELPQISPERIALAARGEMAAVALYAALLDGKVSTLILEAPPATQNAPSQKDGRGPAIEMLSCLRITDLAQVAGLLYPAELIFVGEYPSTYARAEGVYRRLGKAEKFQRVTDLTAWQPS